MSKGATVRKVGLAILLCKATAFILLEQATFTTPLPKEDSSDLCRGVDCGDSQRIVVDKGEGGVAAVCDPGAPVARLSPGCAIVLFSEGTVCEESEDGPKSEKLKELLGEERKIDQRAWRRRTMSAG